LRSSTPRTPTCTRLPKAQSTGGGAYYSKARAPAISGGAVTGGGASYAKTKGFAAAGGAVSGGASDYAKTKAPGGGAGGLQLGGAAATGFTAGIASHSFVASGGLDVGGEAQTSGPIVKPPGAFIYIPHENPLPDRRRTRSYAAGGGIGVAGAASCSFVDWGRWARAREVDELELLDGI
jgi:hypothetical protein